MRGGNVGQLRTYNEHLVLSAILEEGSLSKAALSRRTGLSANAAMIIANELIARGLLVKCQPIRGQVGQPSTPIAVNPEGAFSVGVNIGRRSVQSLLLNFSGEVIAEREQPHEYPEPASSIDTAINQCTDLLNQQRETVRERTVGVGVALPGQLPAWSEELGLAPDALDGWQEVDVQAALTKATGLETLLYNDASAACAAEMIRGSAITHRSALYLYFGTFIGGGIVIGGRLYQGEWKNAGAIGSMPVVTGVDGQARNQLIHRASIYQLETLLKSRGLDPDTVLAGKGADNAESVFGLWMDEAAPAVASSIVSALSVVDFETVVIDGIISPDWRHQLRKRIIGELSRQNLSGLILPTISTGSIGTSAPKLGAAIMPLRAKFSPEPEMVVRRSRP